MKPTDTQHNFHLPLPSELYRELRAEAARLGQPATLLARQAIEAWMEQRRAAALHAEIAAYAAEHGGTDVDLDPQLEAAGLELWREEAQPRTVRKRQKRKR
jgi:predicted DNA-binding protein